ncbi:CAP domain-containing protein [Streptomyces sp. NPDC006784]|uniref:CAP domain-containing protein n=1 Tax=Streptomyces sp. NPDC006784 TaxID=3364764 RepID=UPI00367F0DFF
MSKHRNSKRIHHRKLVIGAVAVAALGVPSVAMACLDGQDDKGSQAGAEPTAQHRGHAAADRDGDDAKHRGGTFTHRGDRSEHRGDRSEPSHHATAAPTRSASAKPTKKAPTKPTAPSSTAPESTTTPADSGSSGLQDQIVALVNKERAKAGCKRVTVDDKLTKAAQAHSEDMAAHKNMSHTGSDGSSPDERIERAGYSWSTYGENVAYGYSSPESVMEGWMNSSGHRANILNCDFEEIGVGHAQPGHYWTQDFGTAR